MKSREKILIIDNYDSFTYNLVHYFEQMADEVEVIRPENISFQAIDKYSALVLSPGPGLPNDIEVLNLVINKFHKTKPILGICLGHQALGLYFGANLYNLAEVHHGVQRKTEVLLNDTIFKNVPKYFDSGRYHSWAICKNNFPASLEIIAGDVEDGTIMAIRHKQYPITGLQFHPESVMTPLGVKIIENWINS